MHQGGLESNEMDEDDKGLIRVGCAGLPSGIARGHYFENVDFLEADDTFFEALFAGSGTTFADIRAKATKGEALTPSTLKAKVTITVDHTYEVVSQQVTHNVVGMIEGTDRRLKDTYVVVGAHLDHVGYSQTGATRDRSTDGCRRRSPAAQAAGIRRSRQWPRGRVRARRASRDDKPPPSCRCRRQP
jgi:hypothetical protein